MISNAKRGDRFSQCKKEIEEDWNPNDTEVQEQELIDKYDRIGNKSIDSRYFVKRQTYTRDTKNDLLRNSLDKYGLVRLSDAWDPKRQRYSKEVSEEQTSKRVFSKSPARSKTPVEGINKPRPSTVLKSKASEEETQIKRLKTIPVKVEQKIAHEEKKKENDIGTEIDEIVEYPDQYFLVDANHPIFLNSPSRIKKEGESNEETIKKYEDVLRDINREFKDLMKRNKYLEARLENEIRLVEPKAEIIERLQQQIEDLKAERQHQSSAYSLERDQSKKEIASLQYQVSILQDKDEKHRIEKSNLQFTVQNLELLNNKLTENERKNQREINQLLEKLSNAENNSKVQEVVVANYNKLRDSYQAEISREQKRRESLENENTLLRKHLSEQAYSIDQLNTQVESLKQTIYSQNLTIDNLKATKKYYEEPARDFAPIKFDQPAGILPVFESKIQADPYGAQFRPFSPERDVKIIPSPVRLSSAARKEIAEIEFNGRAGVKSKKHCTIDCIFSNRPCDQCGKGRDQRTSMNLGFLP